MSPSTLYTQSLQSPSPRTHTSDSRTAWKDPPRSMVTQTTIIKLWHIFEVKTNIMTKQDRSLPKPRLHLYMDGRVQILVDADFKFLHILGPDWILTLYYKNEIVSTHIPLTKTLSRSNLHFKLWQSNTLLQNMSLVLKITYSPKNS